ncbi:MAG: hypothetical protein V7K47_26330 [Nostoc sp.]
MSLMSACESPEGPLSLIHSQGNSRQRELTATQGGNSTTTAAELENQRKP